MTLKSHLIFIIDKLEVDEKSCVKKKTLIERSEMKVVVILALLAFFYGKNNLTEMKLNHKENFIFF